MKRRVMIVLMAFIFIPFFWIAFNVSGCRTTLKDFYVELFDHIRSGQPFGIYDVPRGT